MDTRNIQIQDNNLWTTQNFIPCGDGNTQHSTQFKAVWRPHKPLGQMFTHVIIIFGYIYLSSLSYLKE